MGKEYTVDYQLSKKIQECEKLTLDYKEAEKKTLNYDVLRKMRRQYIHDFIKVSPDLNWFSIHEYLFPALFPDFATNDIKVGRLIAIRNDCLREFAKAYKAKEFDHHVFNKVIKLIGQGKKVLLDELSPEQFELAVKENNGTVSYFDSLLINKMFMIENIERINEEISHAYVFSGCQFVKDVKRFDYQYSFRYNGSEEYLANVCRQLLRFERIVPYSLNEKYVAEKINKNVSKVQEVEMTNNAPKHMFMKMRYIMLEDGQEVGSRFGLGRLSPDTVKENLPEGTTMHHVFADNYYLTIDGFEIDREKLENRAEELDREAAAREVQTIFGK